MDRCSRIFAFGIVLMLFLGLFLGLAAAATPVEESTKTSVGKGDIQEQPQGSGVKFLGIAEQSPEHVLEEEEKETKALPPTSRASVDLAVFKLEVLPAPTGSPSHYPGQECTINATIFNYANTIAVGFTVICAVNDGFSNSSIDSVVVNNPSLSPYQTGIDNVTLKFKFTPPLLNPMEYTYPHSFRVVVTVSIANDEVQKNNQKYTSLGVMKADFQPNFILGQYFPGSGGIIDPTGYDPVQASVGETLTVPFVLENLGSGQDSIKIVTDDAPKNWTVGGFGPIDLDDGENTTDDLRLIVSVSKYKQDALENHDYIIRLKAYSLNYPLATHTLDIHFSIKFAAGIKLDPPYTEKWATPGLYLNIDVILINKGNGKDSFYSSLDPLRDISLKQGWKAYIDEGTLTPAINRDEKYTVKIRVSVPPNVMSGAHAKITLISKSNKAASTSDPVERALSIEVYASKLVKPVLEAQEPAYDIFPGQESLIYFNLTNDGNKRDKTIQVKITSQPDGWMTGLDLSEIPTNGLGFKTVAEIGLKIILPPDVPAKDGYKIRIEAWAGEPLVKHDTLDLNINVMENFDIELTVAETMKYGYVGGIIEFNLNIKNKGNVEDTFLIDATLQNSESYPGWELELSDPLINLSANMTRSVAVYATIPLNASADTNLATSSIYEGYYIDVVVTSQSDPVNTSKKKQFVTKVHPVYSFLASLNSKSAMVSGDRDDVVPFTITIDNTGNIKDIVDFEVESDNDWFSLVTIHKYIPYRESRQAVIQIEPHSGLESDTYEFKFIGTSRGDKSFKQELKITIEVVSYNFEIRNVKIYNEDINSLIRDGKYDPQEGYLITTRDTILIQADIVNTGDEPYISGPYGDVVISFYDGPIPIVRFRVNFTYMEPYHLNQKVYKVSLLWNSTVAEPHLLKIMVDGQDNIPESDETDNRESIYIIVESTIVIEEEETDTWYIIFHLIIPLGIALLIVVLVFLTLYIISSIRITYVDTGYDEDGDYVPFAEQYDAFEGEVEQVEEEEDIEIEMEYDPDHPYSTSSPYQVAGGSSVQIGGAETPYALPPASPYSTAAQQSGQFALPPAASESADGSDIYGFLPEGEVEEITTTVATKPVTSKPVGTKPVTTSKPVVSSKPVISSKPVTSKPVTTKPPVTGTKPVTTKPPVGKPVTTKPPATTTKPPDTKAVTTKPPVTTTKPPDTKPVTTKPPATTTKPPDTKPVTTKPPVTTTKPPDTTPPPPDDSPLKQATDGDADAKPTSLRDLLAKEG